MTVTDLPTGLKEVRLWYPLRRSNHRCFPAAYAAAAIDDCLYALQPTIPHLTRSSLHRCLQLPGISRLPEVEGGKPSKKKFKACPIGYFHIDIAELQTAEGKLYLYVAIDRTSKFAFVQLGPEDGRDLSCGLSRSSDRGRPPQDPHGAHRQ